MNRKEQKTLKNRRESKMIDFRPIQTDDKAIYERYLFADGTRGAECSFGNLFFWGESSIAEAFGCAVLLARFGSYHFYHFPVGAGDKKAAIDAMLSDAAARGIPFRLGGVRAADRAWLTEQYPDLFCFSDARSSHDYVYAIDDLANLSGRRYHGKRNHLYRFRKEHPDYKVLPLEEADPDAVLQMAEQWYTDRLAEDPDADFKMEHRALLLALENYGALGLCGIVLSDGGKVLALTMGSRLSNDTFDVHFEKAVLGVEGAYAAINYEFARYLREKHPDLRFLDREEDMGLLPLRRAKESYKPHHMVEKYRVLLRADLFVGSPSHEDIPALGRLWQEAFGDSDAFLDGFFERIFSPRRARCIKADGKIAAALYLFDCECDGRSASYIYAVATARAFRGQGLCGQLLADTHRYLEGLGCAFAILVPSEPSLFAFYEKYGYRTATSIGELSAVAEDAGIALKEIDLAEYARLRRLYLPPRAVIQEEKTLLLLQMGATLYAGEDFLLAAREENGEFFGIELLGNTERAGAILATLQKPSGCFRCIGNTRPFAMYYPIDKTPRPEYLGLALD